MPSIMEEQVNKAGNEEEEEEEEDDDDGAIRIGDIYIPPPPLPCLSFDPTGPRLMISDIVIENFKSYGGKVALGPFQKNFSAIVGPNGSGKSNVIDSMLFVFGYRAQKIRSQTVGVLIHSSDTHPNVTSCSVNVHFQKIVDKLGDDFDVVKGSEFAISRTAYKDNSSYYSINNRKVPFKEVSRMLRSFGIDLDHNRFLILQGEVEQISLMKPKSPNEHDTGMLEFLEDIIGSGRFKEPIELLAKKVEELNELRTEKLKRVKAVEKEKDELEGPKNEAIEYMNWKNQLTVKRHALTQKYMYECKQKIEEKFQKKKSIETEQSEFLANFDKIAKEIETAEKERTALLKEFANVCKAHEENQTKVNELDILDLQRREDVKHTSGKLKEMVLSLEKEKKKLDDLETVPTKLEEEISSLRKRLDDELAKQKIKFEENEQRVMASLQNETKDIQAEKDKQEQTLMELQKPVDEAGAKVGIAQVELDLYTKNAQNEENRLMEIQAAIEKNVTAIKEMETEIRSLSVELPRIEELVSRDVAELKAVTISETRATEMFKSRRMKLEEMRNAMQTSHSRGRILEALMREKAAGRIPGIVGRLGDLGAIEEKYDIAISTACRPLDNIVTETLTSAEDCVSFLKQHNLGQATFIALDKMQSWNEHIKRKFSPPRGVCRLFDLIEVKDESVLPAFYFALRDTLVANDIDQATAIGLQGMTRYRVVTLKGELIETSGTMSGGGNRPMRGRMGTSVVADAVSAEQVEEVQREVNQLQKSLEELTPKKQALQEGINTQERLAQQMKHTIQKRKMEFEGITQQQKVLKVQLKEQEKRVEATTPDERKIRELTENLKREKNVFDEADRAASNVKAVIQRLHDQIMEISGSKFKAAQKQLHDVNEQIDEATGAINKKMVGIKTAKRNFSKLREKIANIEAEIEESKEKMANLKKVLKEAEDIARNLFEVLGKLKVERTEIEKTLSLVSGRAEKSKAEVQEMKSRKMDIDHELKQLTDALHIEESRMNTWKKDLSKMGLEQIEGTETLELKTLGEDELKEFDMKACNYVITVLDENLKKAKPNLAAIAEYCRKEEVYLQRVEEMDKMTKERDAQRSHHDGLRKQRLTEFMKGFGIITQKLKETYQMLTLGGDAELELVNSLDPFSDGIVFSVRPPRKSWKNISNLSGGEKTLSSLALVFALHYFKPTPFYVMDEIDAALDFRNVTIVGHYIKEQTKNAQFIVISLRNNMFELADRLVGVYKTYNTSHSVAIDPRTASNNAPGS